MIAGPKLNTPISASNKSRSNQPTRAKQQSQPVTAIQQSSKMPGGSPRPSFKRTYCPRNQVRVPLFTVERGVLLFARKYLML